MGNNIDTQYIKINLLTNRTGLSSQKKMPSKEVEVQVPQDSVHISEDDKQSHEHGHQQDDPVHNSMNTAHKGLEIQHASHASHAAHGQEAVHHAGEAAQHASHAAGSGAEAAQQVGQTAANSMEAVQGGCETAQHVAGAAGAADIADAAGAVHGANATDAASQSCDVSDLVNANEASGSLLSNLGYIGGGIVGAYFLPKGIKDMGKAIKQKNGMEGIEAGGEIALGTAGLLNFGKFAAKAAGPGAEAVMHSSALGAVASGLGVVHGAADIIIGGKQIFDGIKGKNTSKIVSGSFDVGIGVSIAAIALGGGIPAAVALGATFVGKTSYKYRNNLKKAGQKAGGAIAGAARKTANAARRTGGAIAGAVKTTANAAIRTGGAIKNLGKRGAGAVRNAVNRLKPGKKEKASDTSESPKAPETVKKDEFVESSTGNNEEIAKKAQLENSMYAVYLNGTFL